MEPRSLFLRCYILIDSFLTFINPVLSFIAILGTSTFLITTIFFYIVHLVPLLHKHLPLFPYTLHTLISFYIILSVTLNYIRCIITPAGSPTTDAETHPKPFQDTTTETRTRSETWRWCIHCRIPKPPRTHHCSTCKKCFLRLCHHCPSMGRCIGRDNYPFFFRFVVLTWVGSLFAAATAACMMKFEKADNTLLFYFGVWSAAMTVSVGVLGGWHVYLVATGQTTIEWLENRGNGFGWSGPFDLGVLGNLKEVFGKGEGLWWRVLMPVGRAESWGEIGS